jgi:hypothetical protein
MSVTRILTTGLLGALLLTPAAAGAQEAAVIERAAAELDGTSDSVYVDPAARSEVSEAQEQEIESAVQDADAGAVYIAVFPAEAGDATTLAQALAGAEGNSGTYAVVAGTQLRAGHTTIEGVVGPLANEAVEAERGNGTAAVLLTFVDLLAQNPPSESGEGGGGGISFFWILVLIGGGLFFFSRTRKRRREQELSRQRLEEVRDVAEEDLVALGEDLRALEIDVEMPSGDGRAKQSYVQALSCYERARERIDQAQRVQDLEPVSAALEEGRWAMASARAHLEGRPPPERRAPCFFDPRHGPSVKDVEWAPPAGSVRQVPACAEDARRVERGEEPISREVMVDGRSTPYWGAPAYYGPWAGGYFGGFGLFEGLLLGSMLSGGFGFGGYEGGFDGGGDSSGGDFGGGDFGGGDFGGGDFGGGDFGGGDFG